MEFKNSDDQAVYDQLIIVVREMLLLNIMKENKKNKKLGRIKGCTC